MRPAINIQDLKFSARGVLLAGAMDGITDNTIEAIEAIIDEASALSASAGSLCAGSEEPKCSKPVRVGGTDEDFPCLRPAEHEGFCDPYGPSNASSVATTVADIAAPVREPDGYMRVCVDCGKRWGSGPHVHALCSRCRCGCEGEPEPCPSCPGGPVVTPEPAAPVREPDGYLTPSDVARVRDQEGDTVPSVNVWKAQDSGDTPVYLGSPPPEQGLPPEDWAQMLQDTHDKATATARAETLAKVRDVLRAVRDDGVGDGWQDAIDEVLTRLNLTEEQRLNLTEEQRMSATLPERHIRPIDGEACDYLCPLDDVCNKCGYVGPYFQPRRQDQETCLMEAFRLSQETRRKQSAEIERLRKELARLISLHAPHLTNIPPR